MLVAKGANVNVVVSGKMPLQYFIAEGNVGLVNAWLAFKPDPMVTDRQGHTAKEGEGYGRTRAAGAAGDCTDCGGVSEGVRGGAGSEVIILPRETSEKKSPRGWRGLSC